MWVGNHDEFERRIGLFPVSFDDKGRMRTHTVLGDYPMSLPQKKFNPQDISAFGWMLQSYHKRVRRLLHYRVSNRKRQWMKMFVPGGRLQVAKQVNIS